MLDWVSWDVRSLGGKEAQIQIVDRASGVWGRIAVDQIVLADAPADASKDRARWVDYGKDFYAVVSWSNIPPKDGRRICIGWMNNWEYGQDIPTTPWRSAQSIPREVRLKAYSGGIHLVQAPVEECERLRGARDTLASTVIAERERPARRKADRGQDAGDHRDIRAGHCLGVRAEGRQGCE